MRDRVEETVPEAADAESIEAPEENPFTGVQLESSDEQFFGSQGPATGAEAGSFGTAAAPMEDFHSNLPAIDLPSVDLPPVDEENAAAGVELKETPPLESVEPTEVARQKGIVRSCGHGSASRIARPFAGSGGDECQRDSATAASC